MAITRSMQKSSVEGSFIDQYKHLLTKFSNATSSLNQLEAMYEISKFTNAHLIQLCYKNDYESNHRLEDVICVMQNIYKKGFPDEKKIAHKILIEFFKTKILISQMTPIVI